MIKSRLARISQISWSPRNYLPTCINHIKTIKCHPCRTFIFGYFTKYFTSPALWRTFQNLSCFEKLKFYLLELCCEVKVSMYPSDSVERDFKHLQISTTSHFKPTLKRTHVTKFLASLSKQNSEISLLVCVKKGKVSGLKQ